MTPEEALRLGRKILDPVLNPYGFQFVEQMIGKGSGGNFACANYENLERRLELHFRQSLGLVRYHFGSLSLSHDEYMAAKLGGRGLASYPGFSTDPLDGFRHLRQDLELHGSDFLSSDQSAFAGLVAAAKRLPRLPV